MQLDFSTLSIEEAIAVIDENKAMDWQLSILEFLKNYQQVNCEIELNEMQGENIFTVAMKKENIQNTVRKLNEFIGIEQGYVTIIPNSIKMKDGVIALAQAIEGKMNAFFTEPSNDIKIPYTGQDQNEVHWGLNYAYLTERQLQESSGILHRIEKVAVESNGMEEETKELLNTNYEEQSIYEVFSVKSFPVAIRNLNDDTFTVVGDVKISQTEEGLLEIDSPNFQEKVDTQKAVVIKDESTFRWLTMNEYLDEDSDDIINFEYIEEKLKPFIDTRFVVINFPDKSTGKEVVTLVVERRYMEEFNYPVEDLKEHEIPKQTYFLGEFPENNDRAAIRKEVKRLLAEE